MKSTFKATGEIRDGRFTGGPVAQVSPARMLAARPLRALRGLYELEGVRVRLIRLNVPAGASAAKGAYVMRDDLLGRACALYVRAVGGLVWFLRTRGVRRLANLVATAMP